MFLLGCASHEHSITARNFHDAAGAEYAPLRFISIRYLDWAARLANRRWDVCCGGFVTCLLESLEQVFLCSHFSLLTLYGDLSKWLCNKPLSCLRISTVFSALLKAKAVAHASILISRKHLIRYVLSSRKKMLEADCWDHADCFFNNHSSVLVLFFWKGALERSWLASIWEWRGVVSIFQHRIQ